MSAVKVTHQATASDTRGAVELAHAEGLRGAHARFYVGTAARETIYRVSRDTAHLWRRVAVVFDHERERVTRCQCEQWVERGVCAHAGAVYMKLGK